MLLLLLAVSHAAVPIWYSAVAGSASAGGCKVVPGKVGTAGAWAYWSNTINATGWAKLNVITNPNGFSDADQAYLAGCVEGTLDHDHADGTVECTDCIATHARAAPSLSFLCPGFVTQDQIWDSWPSFLYANYHESMQVPPCTSLRKQRLRLRQSVYVVCLYRSDLLGCV